jgi:hypothetical protein
LDTERFATQRLQARLDAEYPNETLKGTFSCDNGCSIRIEWSKLGRAHGLALWE